jgi:outer membrane protein assembly factor BamD
LKIKKQLIVITALITLILTSGIFTGCSSSGSGISTDDPQKAFQTAKRKFDRGDYVDAIEDFSFIKIRFPGTEISDKVQFYLAKSYYNQKEYLLAAYEFDSFLKNYPMSELYPEGKYMLGSTYYQLSPKFSLDQEYTREALDELLAYVESYPQDKNVYDAEKKIKELREKLAYRDFYTAGIYMKLDNYKAAALYYQNVYDNYIDSEWADDAMVGQAEAYINGKRYDEAKKVLDKFYKLFPKSSVKSKADRLRSRITSESSQK